MHDNRSIVEDRISRAVTEQITPALYRATAPLAVSVWQVPDEPVPVSEALVARYQPAAVGDAWGPAWSTSWFRFTGTVPPDWAGARVEALIDLGFGGAAPGFQAEGLAYTGDGRPIKGIAPRTGYVPVAAAAGQPVSLLVEAAANPNVAGDWSFRPTPLGDKRTAGPAPLYRIVRADLAALDLPVWELAQDVWCLDGLMRVLQPHDPRRHQILRSLERMLDTLDPADVPGTADSARKQLSGVLASPAAASAHRVIATGHAHIDSAWLWPVRETIRKTARTFSNVVALMDAEPDFVFACSQAQQLAWVKAHHPAVFERIREKVGTGQFVPVGGMWVEADTNMPGGEAMVRQFVTGKRFYSEEFGVEPLEVWLPDSFGYSAAMPQIAARAGCRWFLTQKISWNQTNRMPHHTFWWEGIDGSRVFTHFPPVDTYNSELSAAELAHASDNYAEHGYGTMSLVPFGWGDGGGGPTREMIAAARRTADLEGSPRVRLGSPREFFQAAEAELATVAGVPVWRGELYLELHRGTYTSQARTKQGNRRSEHLLREAELWSATAAVAGLVDYPYDQLDRLWKRVLLNQFHDILPGSSIAWVHREAEAAYAEIAGELGLIIDEARVALAGTGTVPLLFNAAPFARAGVAALGAGTPLAAAGVSVSRDGDSYVLDNATLRVVLDAAGLISSVYDLPAGREAIAPGSHANLLQLHRDQPNRWDAWDIDQHYRNVTVDLTEVAEIEPVAGGVRVRRRFGSSSVEQTITLSGGSGIAARQVNVRTVLDWHESAKLLKVAFGLDVHADQFASETQFGHLYRPTHVNTSWDAARFEVCAHRWVHVGEPGYGVAVVNDSTYGHDVNRVSRPEGGTTTTLRLSLIRAPRFPDPDTDQGEHILSYALVVGVDVGGAIEAGYDLNLPARTVLGAAGVGPLLSVDNPAVVVECVKLAEDRSGDLVVRLYESRGGRASAQVSVAAEVSQVQETDLLERPITEGAVDSHSSDGFSVRLRPFQIVTVRLRLSGGAVAQPSPHGVPVL
ncbi:alpha-mannosidase [Jatrophihabitans sp.]|jgi:alpha-mannosidase|uniref:alpha-mannosidase n=1 Tax=Jatrophihabitans sp. TaxID=1932789 RepID=UPI002F21D51A